MLIAASEEHNRMVEADREVLSKFEPDTPWNYVLHQAVVSDEARNWWYQEYDQRVIEIKLKTITMKDVIDNDAPVAMSRAEHASFARAEAPTARPAFTPTEPPTKRQKTQQQQQQELRQQQQRQSAAAADNASVTGGKLTTSSKKSKQRTICAGFNLGQCSKANAKHDCPRDAAKIHACDRCGGPGHTSEQCRTKDTSIGANAAKKAKKTGRGY